MIFQKTMFRTKLAVTKVAVTHNADLRSGTIGECAGLLFDGHAAPETKNEM